MLPAARCEFPLVILCVAFLIFGSRGSQSCCRGDHPFSSFVRLLRVTNYHQYYTFGTTAIFFYDYLLTLGDEVSHYHQHFFPLGLIVVKGQVRLVWEEIMGYADGRPALRGFADNGVVFVLFLVVRPPQ